MNISLDIGYLFFLIYKFLSSIINAFVEPIANILGFGEYYRGWSFLNTITGSSPASADDVGLFGEGLFEVGGYNLFNDGTKESFNFFFNFFNNPFGGESFYSMTFGSWPGFSLFFAILLLLLGLILKKFYIAPLRDRDKIINDTVYDRQQIPVDKKKNSRWQKILDSLDSENEGAWKTAIIDADVLLDELLTQQGLKGDTLGEKLKDAEHSDFKTLESAWTAHKERNRIAHGGPDYSITKREAKRIISLYAQVFSEFYH